MSKNGKRAVVFASFAVIGTAGVLVYDNLGGWPGVTYSARLYYLSVVPPLFWPEEPFTPASWQGLPAHERYRLSKSLLGSGTLVGSTTAKLSTMLGEDIPPSASTFKYALRRGGFQNLWWVLVLEFEDGRCSSARRDLAWLDP